MLINNQVFITRFVIFTFCVTAIHFILESLYTIQFGQSFLGLLPDLIADALLVTGGVLVLQNSKAIGILCGAWGFTFCLHYRSRLYQSVAWRSWLHGLESVYLQPQMLRKADGFSNDFHQ